MGNMPISDQVMAMPGLSSTSGGVMDVGNERQAQETEDFDALFEEMVASIPQTRYVRYPGHHVFLLTITETSPHLPRIWVSMQEI